MLNFRLISRYDILVRRRAKVLKSLWQKSKCICQKCWTVDWDKLPKLQGSIRQMTSII